MKQIVFKFIEKQIYVLYDNVRKKLIFDESITDILSTSNHQIKYHDGHVNVSVSSSENPQFISVLDIDDDNLDNSRVICEAMAMLWPILPLSDKKVSENDIFKNLANSNELCFYGGSFNPLHEGHKECVRQFESENNGHLIIVPDSNPLKNLRNSQHPLSRWQSLCKEFPNSYVYPGFCALEVSNPTIDWLSDFKNTKRLLMGTDNFLNLEKWKDWKNLVTILSEIFVVPRLSDDNEISSKIAQLKSINPKLVVTILRHHEFESLSSTEIRNKSDRQ